MPKMETLHIKLETEDAIESKKALLSTEINLLNMIKAMQKYKDLRKQELTRKIALRARLRQLTAEMKKLKILLPKTKIQEKEEGISPEKRTRLEDELKEIRDKLASLS